MASSRVHRFLYKWGWDTRCRALDTLRAVNAVITPETTVLDVGCGEFGIAAFLRGTEITGCDILPPEAVSSEMKYVYGSVADLPFADGEFDVVLAIDVLEHLPEDLRAAAVEQLVRVARRAVIATFPSTPGGRGVDEDFESSLRADGREMPEWLAEHLASPYPDKDEVRRGIVKASGVRRVEVQGIASERLSNARLVRWAALRSPYLFLAASVFTGLLYPLIPRPSPDKAYRTILMARFAS